MKQRSCSQIISEIALFCIITTSPVSAQVSSDGTVLTNVTTQDSLNFTITNGEQVRSNLFHSFNEFSVPTGGAVFFDNSPDVQNIISRVTGLSVSKIDGLIRANGAANLFLLNPNGIIFGSNASLNIGGSFLASTASSLNFADSKFSATFEPTTPLLSVNVPAGLQFGESPGSILVEGNGQGIRATTNIIDTSLGLRVPSTQTLALVGGDVVISGGTLKTAGGRIELGSVAGSGLVNLTPIDKGWALDYQGVSAFKDIQLSQKAAVDASGAGGGTIQVQGKQVTLTGGSQIETSTLRSEPGGILAVKALESLELSGESADGQAASALAALVSRGATGSGGNLTVETGHLIVRDGAQITASTSGLGNAGALTVRAFDFVNISKEGKNPSGLFAQARPRATGSGGNLIIDTGRLSVQDGAQIAASTFGSGNAGNLIVRASDLVELSGKGKFFSGLFAQQAEPGATGNGGNLNIEAARINIRDEATATVRSRGEGNAGNLQVQANSIRLDNGGKLTATSAAGKGGGNININNQDLLLLLGNAEISTNAGGAGNGGNININTDLLAVTTGSNITANAIRGRGGNIRISTSGLFRSSNSNISATSEQGINGVVEINRPDSDPSAELIELPANIVDLSSLVASSCKAGGMVRVGSEFVVSGRGGLPPTPAEATRSDTAMVDLGMPVQSEENRISTKIPSNLTIAQSAPALVEASGWVIGDKGEIVLTASSPTATPDIPWLTPTSCHGS